MKNYVRMHLRSSSSDQRHLSADGCLDMCPLPPAPKIGQKIAKTIESDNVINQIICVSVQNDRKSCIGTFCTALNE